MIKCDIIPPPSGWFHLQVFRCGKLVEEIDEPNLIVAGYADINARLLGGNPGYAIAKIGFGTNGAVPQSTDRTLTGAYVKAVDQVAYVPTGKAIFSFSLAGNEANGVAIAEFGLLTLAGSLLYARKVRGAALQKTADISFSGTWTLQS